MEGLVVLVALLGFFYWMGRRSARKKGDIEFRVQTIREHPRVDRDVWERSDDQPYEDRDAWEGSFWDVEQPYPVEATLAIQYEDGNGRKSERTIDVRQFGAYGPATLLIAHCRLRDATRTFRSDRVKECIDVETGEIVEDIYAHLKTKYQQSPEYQRDTLLESEYDTLRVLFYVGKADGQLRQEEKAVIYDLCRELADSSKLTDHLLKNLIAQLELPSLHAFKLAVGRLSKRDAQFRSRLFDAARDIVETQKTIHPSEQEALDYIEKRFSAGAA